MLKCSYCGVELEPDGLAVLYRQCIHCRVGTMLPEGLTFRQALEHDLLVRLGALSKELDALQRDMMSLCEAMRATEGRRLAHGTTDNALYWKARYQELQAKQEGRE